MTTNDVLNQDEIDALLGGDEDQNQDKQRENLDPTKPRSYDLSNQDVFIKGKMPTLEMINERFIRNLRGSLFDLLRKTPEINYQGTTSVKYSEYIHSLFFPTSINVVKVSPLKGNALFIIDAKLVFALVETFFGGEGKVQTKIEGREFTPTENRVIQLTLEKIYKDLLSAWESTYKIQFEHVESEVNPAMVNLVPQNEILIVNKFRIELEGGSGELHVAFPYAMIEPIKDYLDANVKPEKVEVDQNWKSALKKEILSALVDAKCVLGKKHMKLIEVAKFNVGDVVPINIFDNINLLVNGIPVFKGNFGIHDGKYSIKISDKINSNY